MASAAATALAGAGAGANIQRQRLLLLLQLQMQLLQELKLQLFELKLLGKSLGGCKRLSPCDCSSQVRSSVAVGGGTWLHLSIQICSTH